MYSSEDVSALFEHAIDLIDVDKEAALQKFKEGIRRAGHCMQRTFVDGSEESSPWFNNKCREKRRLLWKTLGKYNKASSVVEAADLRAEYTDQRKKYKLLLQEKKAEH